ncbi:SLOG family protein [Sphingopyxis sp. JAI128]|nr:SLOG family protein [Sphingopyxis sp. JAI128]
MASLWARERGVATIVFRPDWAQHGKATPFKRNDRMLESFPSA